MDTGVGSGEREDPRLFNQSLVNRTMAAIQPCEVSAREAKKMKEIPLEAVSEFLIKHSMPGNVKNKL